MGDPNASIPTPQPVHYRPMFGAFGKAVTRTSVTFVSRLAVENGLRDRLGLDKQLVAVENTRGGLSKASMIHNHATPVIEVDPRPTSSRPTARSSPANRRHSAHGPTVFPVLMPATPITDVLPAKAWSGVAVDRVVLGLRRPPPPAHRVDRVSGAEYLLDLAEATHLRDGDGLVIAGGGILLVVARPSPAGGARGLAGKPC